MTVYSLLVALLMALAGCTVPEPAAEPAPPVQVSAETWRQIDRDINAASLTAWGAAENYARGSMEAWISRVRQRSDEEFIPWYTAYWTQQWLAIKVAWYKLGGGEGENPAARRLAAYLQEQFRERVLEPVAAEIDPGEVMQQTTTLYVRLLVEQLQGLPRRYAIPAAQFEARLKAIPAIVPATAGAQSATLLEVVETRPIVDLPAYAALLARIRETDGGPAAGPANDRISAVAERAAEQLMDRLALGGGASAAAAAAGGVAGLLISLGATTIGAIAYENDRPALQVQLRENLNAALDERWQTLVENPSTGVLAGAYHIARQVEGSVLGTRTVPPDGHDR
ncbi:hypothetical protein [Accumulibacter sp.]|uniref:hypothetical protein n=1 Tax=Accumulibacter sp. TaxID=2053492 RepID=UPI0028C42064|nr:hypothetical protein [Accumulibacter sp.]